MFNTAINQQLAEIFQGFQATKVMAEFEQNNIAHAFVIAKDSRKYWLYECENGEIVNTNPLADSDDKAGAQVKASEILSTKEQRFFGQS